MHGSAEPPTTSDFPTEVAFFCPMELARFARSRGLATLAPSRGCRLFSVSDRASLPVLPLRTGHLPECLQLQPPRHPHTAYSVPDRKRSWNFMCSVREPRSSAGCFQLQPPFPHVSPTSPPRLPHVSPTSPPRTFLGRGAPRHCLASALPLSAVKPAFIGLSVAPSPASQLTLC